MPESDPIRVFPKDGEWLIDYGSYMHGSHRTRGEAIETAWDAASAEGRELVVEVETDAARDAIRVFPESRRVADRLRHSAHGDHETRDEAIETAWDAAGNEGRELVVEAEAK